MTDFIVRQYGKQELATCYLPDVKPASALKTLNRWIRHCAPLQAELAEAHYRPSQHYFTPKQVSLLVKYLGEP